MGRLECIGSTEFTRCLWVFLITLNIFEHQLWITWLEEICEFGNGIVLVGLSRHTNHKMQPLDCTIYGTLKTNYNSECDKWMVSKAGRQISPNKCDNLFVADCAHCNYAEAISGFKWTAVWSLNPDIFNKENFAASLVTENMIKLQSTAKFQLMWCSRTLPSGPRIDWNTCHDISFDWPRISASHDV